MDPAILEILRPFVAIGMLVSVGVVVKHLVWGRGPIAGRRAVDPALEQRVAELEERLAQSGDILGQQAEVLADVEERLDFAERLLTQRAHDARGMIEEPREPTPV